MIISCHATICTRTSEHMFAVFDALCHALFTQKVVLLLRFMLLVRPRQRRSVMPAVVNARIRATPLPPPPHFLITSDIYTDPDVSSSFYLSKQMILWFNYVPQNCLLVVHAQKHHAMSHAMHGLFHCLSKTQNAGRTRKALCVHNTHNIHIYIHR